MADDPIAHLGDTVVLCFPIEAFFAFVSFMASGSRVALGLSYFGYVNQYGGMFFAADVCGLFVYLTEFWIIPSASGEEFQSLAFFVALETAH